MFSVHPIEGFWLLINLVGFGVAAWLLSDALADRAAIRAANGRAREIIGSGGVRREVIRLAVSVLLLVVVVPGLFVDREIALSPPLAALMLVPALITANGLLDAQERRRLAALLQTDIDHERRQKLREAR